MRNRKLGFVFQDIRFLDGLTVQENILLLAIIGGTVSAMTEARADQLCDVFGISAIRNKYPAEISGGKKQRTAVARPLIPPADPDRRAYEQLGLQVLPAKSALGATIFMVPHESFDISSCDRVEILRDGVIWRTLERGSLERSTFQDQLLDAIWDMDKE